MLPCERKRYFALWHVYQGHAPQQIERLGLMNADSVRKTIHLYRQGGLAALKERVHPGRQSPLTEQIMDDVILQLQDTTRTWSTLSLQSYIQEKHGFRVGRTAIGVQLRKRKISWQRTRLVVAGQADAEQKQDFKTELETLKKGL